METEDGAGFALPHLEPTINESAHSESMEAQNLFTIAYHKFDAPGIIVKLMQTLESINLEHLQKQTVALKRCIQSEFVETREISDLMDSIDDNCRVMRKHRIRTNLQTLLSLIRPIDNEILLSSLRQNMLTSGVNKYIFCFSTKHIHLHI